MNVIYVTDLARLKAAREVIAHRVNEFGATPNQRTRAASVLHREMQRGGSTATALALALRQLRPTTDHHDGGAA